MSRFYIFVEFFGIRQFPKFCPIIHWSPRAIILFNNYFIKLLKNGLENQLRLSTVVVAYFHSVWKSQKKFHYILNIATELRSNFIEMPKLVNLASFWNPEVCGQTVLPDRSILTGQKLKENGTFCVIFKHCVFCFFLNNFATRL